MPSTPAEREAKRLELEAVTAEWDAKIDDVAATRVPYRQSLAAAQECWDRYSRIEDEYEALVVESEPPLRPIE